MVNVTLLWLLLIPISLSVASLFVLPKVAPGRFSRQESAIFTVVGVLIGCGIMAAAFYVGAGFKTSDTEIWNGAVTSKDRIHDSYVHPYECNCTETCSGSGSSRSCTRTCQTCYEDHYTVTWDCKTTIGRFVIKHLDWTSKRVYKEPNPSRWEIIKKDDPVSYPHSYTNYVQAVPESLFRPAPSDLKKQFVGMIPTYPIGLYDYYKVDRVLPVKVNVPNIREWNDKLQDTLKFIGPTKQVNAVIVMVNTTDSNYEYALRDAWLGAKKNDVVLVIGTTQYPKIEWVRVISWTDREIFKVKLRDDIMAMGELNVDNVMSSLKSNITETFVRKRMRDFKYLEDEIDPPMWVMVTIVCVMILSYLGFWGFMYYDNKKSFSRFGRRSL